MEIDKNRGNRWKSGKSIKIEEIEPRHNWQKSTKSTKTNKSERHWWHRQKSTKSIKNRQISAKLTKIIEMDQNLYFFRVFESLRGSQLEIQGNWDFVTFDAIEIWTSLIDFVKFVSLSQSKGYKGRINVNECDWR